VHETERGGGDALVTSLPGSHTAGTDVYSGVDHNQEVLRHRLLLVRTSSYEIY